MTSLETNLLEVLTHEAVCFCSRAVRPSYKTFTNGFAKKALTGPYRSYDKQIYLIILHLNEKKSENCRNDHLYNLHGGMALGH